jgi:hypothetical protein
MHKKDILLTQFLTSLPVKVRGSQAKINAKIRDHFAARTGFVEKSCRYGFEVAPHTFRLFDERSFIRELGVRGFHYTPPTKRLKHDAKNRETKKDLEARRKTLIAELLSQIRETRVVDFIGELSGYRPRIYDNINGYRLLITRSAEIPAPKKGDFSFYENFLISLSKDTLHGERQYHTVKTWCKFAGEIREAGPPFAPLQALIMAGGVQHGKTLFAEEVLGSLLGGARRRDPPFYQ